MTCHGCDNEATIRFWNIPNGEFDLINDPPPIPHPWEDAAGNLITTLVAADYAGNPGECEDDGGCVEVDPCFNSLTLTFQFDLPGAGYKWVNIEKQKRCPIPGTRLNVPLETPIEEANPTRELLMSEPECACMTYWAWELQDPGGIRVPIALGLQSLIWVKLGCSACTTRVE